MATGTQTLIAANENGLHRSANVGEVRIPHEGTMNGTANDDFLASEFASMMMKMALAAMMLQAKAEIPAVTMQTTPGEVISTVVEEMMTVRASLMAKVFCALTGRQTQPRCRAKMKMAYFFLLQWWDLNLRCCSLLQPVPVDDSSSFSFNFEVICTLAKGSVFQLLGTDSCV